MDGEGYFFRAIITVATNHRCLYKIIDCMPQQPAWKGHLHLAMAPTKLMDRVEWFAEKATEIGFDELTFLDTQFSERKVVKEERIEKILVSAMKQSRKAWKPQLNGMQSFKDFVSTHATGKRFIAHCYEEVPRVNLFQELRKDNPCDALVLIGPEGDFSIDEVRMAVDAGFISVDLGSSRLRTETAGLSAVMMMQLAKQ
jgi:16S rRNA (uracil1498-N3)-methyltransferase